MKQVLCIEYAGYVACALKFGTCYVPDYAFYYFDNKMRVDLMGQN